MFSVEYCWTSASEIVVPIMQEIHIALIEVDKLHPKRTTRIFRGNASCHYAME